MTASTLGVFHELLNIDASVNKDMVSALQNYPQLLRLLVLLSNWNGVDRIIWSGERRLRMVRSLGAIGEVSPVELEAVVVVHNGLDALHGLHSNSVASLLMGSIEP